VSSGPTTRRSSSSSRSIRATTRRSNRDETGGRRLNGARRSQGHERVRETSSDDFLAGARGQQRHLWWTVVPALRGLLTHLRADAHTEPDAWLAVHAGRLFRRHIRRRLARYRIRLLGGGAARCAAGRGLRRAGRASSAATTARPATGTGAGYARHLLHGSRFLLDDLGRRPDQRHDAGRPDRLYSRGTGGIPAVPGG